MQTARCRPPSIGGRRWHWPGRYRRRPTRSVCVSWHGSEFIISGTSIYLLCVQVLYTLWRTGAHRARPQCSACSQQQGSNAPPWLTIRQNMSHRRPLIPNDFDTRSEAQPPNVRATQGMRLRRGREGRHIEFVKHVRTCVDKISPLGKEIYTVVPGTATE